MTLSSKAKVWLGLFLAASLAEFTAELTRWGVGSGILIAVLMPLLGAFVVAARRRRELLLRWVLIALGFSWLGDTLGFFILVKIMFFLVAQVAYIAAFWPYRRRSVAVRPVRLISYAAVLAALIIVMARFAADLWIAIVIYGVAIGLMAVLASGLNRTAGIGGALFVLSDTLIAIDTFARPGYLPAAGFLIMVSYLAAQLLLVWGALEVSHARLSQPSDPLTDAQR